MCAAGAQVRFTATIAAPAATNASSTLDATTRDNYLRAVAGLAGVEVGRVEVELKDVRPAVRRLLTAQWDLDTRVSAAAATAQLVAQQIEE
eukprot:3938295-Rhodomonas_salina.1